MQTTPPHLQNHKDFAYQKTDKTTLEDFKREIPTLLGEWSRGNIIYMPEEATHPLMEQVYPTLSEEEKKIVDMVGGICISLAEIPDWM